MQPTWNLQTGGNARHIPNAVLGTIIFVAAEVMFFAGLISAQTIARSSAIGGIWPPPGQPRLPIERTAINTAALLLSGVFLWIGNHYIRRAPQMARRFIEGAILLGVAFVSLQGIEWVRLIGEGLTLTSSSHGSFFYLIVGTHALHAVAAIVALTWAYSRMCRGRLKPATFAASQIFWYFVVILWPVIYLRVYL